MYHSIINYTSTLQIKFSDKEKKLEIFQNKFSRISLKSPWLIRIKQQNNNKIVFLINIDN